ncbi:MAG TPA: DUF881 domain-containing protein [Actinobacteria bacterium]|nr:DUF881 domain-containing protein [Actinomycetes bacterium]HEX21155.1 DUF881 domain-containing protein [Actinomycetota bacterium]
MSIFNYRKLHLSLAVVFIILGILLSTSYYARKKWDISPGPRKRKLIDFIDRQNKERHKLEYELKGLRADVTKLQKTAANSKGQIGAFAKEMDNLKKQSGLTSLKGDGIEVVISDATVVPSNRDPNNYLVHDYDLQIIVNALWRGGARGISLNGQRFVSTTAIRCAGTTVMVNSEPLGGPYKIEAIGSQSKLIKILKKDPDAKQVLQSYAKTYGLNVDVRQVDELKLPAYKGSLKFNDIEVVAQ